MRVLLLTLATLLSAQIFSQAPTFRRFDSVIVRNVLGIQIANPWAGGFNSVQFSEIDLDLDGTKDLMVYDKQFYRVTTWINGGTAGVPDYKHAPKYQKAFPFAYNWMLCRDMNCDGKEDVICYNNASAGMSYYKNVSSPGNLLFQLQTQRLQFLDPPPTKKSILAGPPDLPAIDDIDGDGDIDILAWDWGGKTIWYYQNQGMDLYGACDTVLFELKNSCWGYIKDTSISTIPWLHQHNCPNQVSNPEKKTPNYGSNNTKAGQHPGGTLLTLDIDGDTVKDLVMSYVHQRNLMFLPNGGRKDSAEFNAVDTLFPQNHNSTIAAGFENFPAGFYLDVDNDSVKDLIASPFDLTSATAIPPVLPENHRSAWFYKNTGTTDNPAFQYVSNEFLQNGMIEVGDGAFPRFFDFNNDTLEDLVIGNHGYNNNTSNMDAQLALYENIGTATKPEYRLVSKDFGGLSSIMLDPVTPSKVQGLIPTFGDMDGDGDEDMFVGDDEGYIHYFQNTALPGNNANFVVDSIRFQDAGNNIIDVGVFAAPYIVDLDRDGKLDLIIGKRAGSISYYRNTGSTTNQAFTLITPTLGNINTTGGFFVGFAVPYVHDKSGSYEMYVGSFDRGVFHVTNIDANLAGTFTITEDTLNGIWEGGRVAPSGADINNDGMLDLVIGNYCGGVALYEQGIFTAEAESPVVQELASSVYPNPSNSAFNFQLNGNYGNAYLKVYDLFGRSVATARLRNTGVIQMSHFSAGTYVYVVESENQKHKKIGKLVLLK